MNLRNQVYRYTGRRICVCRQVGLKYWIKITVLFDVTLASEYVAIEMIHYLVGL